MGEKDEQPAPELENKGRLAEWLGSGLQNRVRRFESATDLIKIPFKSRAFKRDFFISTRHQALLECKSGNKKIPKS